MSDIYYVVGRRGRNGGKKGVKNLFETVKTHPHLVVDIDLDRNTRMKLLKINPLVIEYLQNITDEELLYIIDNNIRILNKMKSLHIENLTYDTIEKLIKNDYKLIRHVWKPTHEFHRALIYLSFKEPNIDNMKLSLETQKRLVDLNPEFLQYIKNPSDMLLLHFFDNFSTYSTLSGQFLINLITKIYPSNELQKLDYDNIIYGYNYSLIGKWKCEVQMRVIKNDIKQIKIINKPHLDVQKYILKNHPDMIRHIKDININILVELCDEKYSKLIGKIDFEVYSQWIRAYHYLFVYINDKSQITNIPNDETWDNFVIEIVSQNHKCINVITNKEMRLRIIEREPLVILQIKNPTYEEKQKFVQIARYDKLYNKSYHCYTAGDNTTMIFTKHNFPQELRDIFITNNAKNYHIFYLPNLTDKEIRYILTVNPHNITYIHHINNSNLNYDEYKWFAYNLNNHVYSGIQSPPEDMQLDALDKGIIPLKNIAKMSATEKVQWKILEKDYKLLINTNITENVLKYMLQNNEMRQWIIKMVKDINIYSGDYIINLRTKYFKLVCETLTSNCNNYDGNVCSLCLDDFENNDVYKLKCDHYYHVECVKELFNSQVNVCTICEKQIYDVLI